jgi:hypothetical protein
MNARRFYRIAVRCASRGAVGLAVLGFVFMSLGISAGSIGQKDRSTPFPCMLSRCACKTASDYWRSCCCHSLAERLAWARKRNIEPPPEVLSKAAEINATEKRACCATDGSAERVQRCCAKTAGSHAGCADCANEQPGDEFLPARTEAGIVSLDAKPSCSGVGDTWSGLPPVTTIACTTLTVELDPCGWSDLLSERFYSATLRRLERPPRISF